MDETPPNLDQKLGIFCICLKGVFSEIKHLITTVCPMVVFNSARSHAVLETIHSQEEIGELKAELRKTVSEAKNTVRRLSAGRSNMASGAGAFGFTPRGTGVGGDGMAPGKGAPHTPSKKLSEAKSRYMPCYRSLAVTRSLRFVLAGSHWV